MTIKGEWNKSSCSLHVTWKITTGILSPSGRQRHSTSPGPHCPGHWIQFAAFSSLWLSAAPLEIQGFSFSSLHHTNCSRMCQILCSSTWAGFSRKAPSLLLVSAIDSVLLPAAVSFPHSRHTPWRPDVWLIILTSHFQQQPSETQWGKHLLRRHCQWLETYDPNYFWSLTWMILSGPVLSLSNLQHSKFPHSILK